MLSLLLYGAVSPSSVGVIDPDIDHKHVKMATRDDSIIVGAAAVNLTPSTPVDYPAAVPDPKFADAIDLLMILNLDTILSGMEDNYIDRVSGGTYLSEFMPMLRSTSIMDGMLPIRPSPSGLVGTLGNSQRQWEVLLSAMETSLTDAQRNIKGALGARMALDLKLTVQQAANFLDALFVTRMELSPSALTKPKLTTLIEDAKILNILKLMSSDELDIVLEVTASLNNLSVDSKSDAFLSNHVSVPFDFATYLDPLSSSFLSFGDDFEKFRNTNVPVVNELIKISTVINKVSEELESRYGKKYSSKLVVRLLSAECDDSTSLEVLIVADPFMEISSIADAVIDDSESTFYLIESTKSVFPNWDDRDLFSFWSGSILIESNTIRTTDISLRTLMELDDADKLVDLIDIPPFQLLPDDLFETSPFLKTTVLAGREQAKTIQSLVHWINLYLEAVEFPSLQDPNNEFGLSQVIAEMQASTQEKEYDGFIASGLYETCLRDVGCRPLDDRLMMFSEKLMLQSKILISHGRQNIATGDAIIASAAIDDEESLSDGRALRSSGQFTVEDGMTFAMHASLIIKTPNSLRERAAELVRLSNELLPYARDALSKGTLNDDQSLVNEAESLIARASVFLSDSQRMVNVIPMINELHVLFEQMGSDSIQLDIGVKAQLEVASFELYRDDIMELIRLSKYDDLLVKPVDRLISLVHLLEDLSSISVENLNSIKDGFLGTGDQDALKKLLGLNDETFEFVSEKIVLAFDVLSDADRQSKMVEDIRSKLLSDRRQFHTTSDTDSIILKHSSAVKLSPAVDYIYGIILDDWLLESDESLMIIKAVLDMIRLNVV
eukprot:GHVH01005064.1.p1 GENE.GHVH01005064.1~~GHVH01005064.1.p1  ORF type:complete len:838 (+),score=144.06 GHVH01005064.1:1044-3557(+)